MKVTIKDRVLYSPCPTIDIPCCSIFSVLKTGVESAAKKVVLVDDRLQLTPAEFFSRAKRYAVGFQACGVKPGDRIGVHLDNSVDNLAAIFGLVFAGVTLILAESSLTERDLQYHIAAGDASRILTDPKNEPKAIRVKKLLDLKDVFVMGATADGINASEFESVDEKSFEELPVPDPKATVVALAFAVDTTGPPKAVEITHYSFVANFYTSRYRKHCQKACGSTRSQRKKGGAARHLFARPDHSRRSQSNNGKSAPSRSSFSVGFYHRPNRARRENNWQRPLPSNFDKA